MTEYEIQLKHIPPFVSLQVNITPPKTFKEELNNDPEFQRWIFLYHNKIKNTDEYKNLYQKLRHRYKISPIQIVSQY